MDENHRIGRRIYQTTCHCITYDENKKRVEFDLTIPGNFSSLKRAASAVKRELKNPNVLVTDYTLESHFYSMSTDTFIKYADKISD